MDRDERGRAVALEQRHPAATAGDEEHARLEPFEQLASRLLDGALVVDGHAGELGELRLVGRGSRGAREARKVVATVHRDDRIRAAGDGLDALEDARGDGPVAVVRDEDRVDARRERAEPAEQRVLGGRHEVLRRLAVEADQLLARRRVTAGHDARLHGRRAARLRHQAVGRHAGGVKERLQLLPRPVAPDHADRDDARAERVDVVRRIRRAAQQHLALDKSQDQDGRLARDPRRLAEEILVGDEVADDDDRARAEGVDRGAHPARRRAHAERPASTQSTASSRSFATWSGSTGKLARRYSHSPSP